MSYRWTDPSQTPGISPELHLVRAILHQAVHDAQSRRPDVREEARAFLANPAGLRYWEDFLGLQDGALTQRMQRALHRQAPR